MSSLSLAVSMPATAVLVFVIFVDPCLVKRTRLFRQPSGSDEGADDDHATGQPQTAQGGLDPIASRSAADGESAAEHSFRNTQTISDCAITRVGKGALATCPPRLGAGGCDRWARFALPTLPMRWSARKLAARKPLVEGVE